MVDHPKGFGVFITSSYAREDSNDMAIPLQKGQLLPYDERRSLRKLFANSRNSSLLMKVQVFEDGQKKLWDGQQVVHLTSPPAKVTLT